jgi:hypothetical protein
LIRRFPNPLLLRSCLAAVYDLHRPRCCALRANLRLLFLQARPGFRFSTFPKVSVRPCGAAYGSLPSGYPRRLGALPGPHIRLPLELCAIARVFSFFCSAPLSRRSREAQRRIRSMLPAPRSPPFSFSAFQLCSAYAPCSPLHAPRSSPFSFSAFQLFLSLPPSLEVSSQQIEDRDQKKASGTGFRDRSPLRARDQAIARLPHSSQPSAA